MSKISHPDEVAAVHERILGTSRAQGRQLDLGKRGQVHLIEAGDGPPLLLLHGGGTSALQMLPLIERLDGVRAIAPDRPGFGLSAVDETGNADLRDRSMAFIDSLLDTLGLEDVHLAGNSMGGIWALWYVLTRPERVRRLLLVGSAPLLPGTRAPLPLKLMVAPGLGELMGRLPANRNMIVQMMGQFGEGESIVNYSEQIDALVAAGNDPLADRVNLGEMRAVLTPFGFRQSVRFTTDDLARVTVPTLLIWGDGDPIASEEAGSNIAAAIPDARLEVVPGGHMPWLASPDRTAELVVDFVS